MKLFLDDINRYPKFANYVRHGLHHVLSVPAIAQLVDGAEEVNMSRVEEALHWGTKPRIVVAELSQGHAEFNRELNPDMIKVSAHLVRAFEASELRVAARIGRVNLLGVVILRELVKWSDGSDMLSPTSDFYVGFDSVINW